MGRKRVAIAMSGGVDSSLVAAKMIEQGYDVVGITMLLFDTKDGNNIAPSQMILDAKQMADFLGIAHYVIDLREAFRNEIIEYFVSSYRMGITPNPCVLCNKNMKFGWLYKEAMALGADGIATGHYARIVNNDTERRHEIHMAKDIRKDQSYVLFHLKESMLKHVFFPLGEMNKTDTRREAKQYGLPVYNKPESQDICFIPDNDHLAFMKEHTGKVFKYGDIIDMNGNILGEHKGIAAYTIGQRRGLGIAASRPLYVLAIDSEKNRIVVGEETFLFSDRLTAVKESFLDAERIEKPFEAFAKIRYGAKPALCTVYPHEGGLDVVFKEKQRAITPGQSIVFYDQERLIGGAIIAKNPLNIGGL